MNRRLKILVSAYACEPGKGSEPGVGWNNVQQAARFHDVWVMTRSNNRALIEEALATEPMPNVQWVYLDLPRWASFWKKGQRGIHLYYSLWQILAYRKARKLHRDVGFDLTHHVTFVNYWLPIFLPLLPIPFVWGPVGGGESTPRSFRGFFSLRGRMYEATRELARSLAELSPFVRIAARRAAVALATTKETATRLEALGCKRVSILPEAALPSSEINELRAIPPCGSGTFRVLSLGRFVHWKGFELGLRAFARFQARFPNAEYWFIGEGPEQSSLERLSRELGIENKVIFWGFLSRDRVLEKLAACDVLLFPSLHDSGGWVTLEAMAAGRPVICLDLGGPALRVTEATGIKIPAINPEQATADVTAALERLAADPAHVAELAQAGRQRIDQEFNWERRGGQLARLCDQVVNASEQMAGRDRPLKVLISAYSCEPGKGSEPGVGWNHVKQAARFHKVWVMTRSNNRALIEEALATEPMPNVQWIYLDLPSWARFWKKGQRGVRFYYSLWQIVAYRKARKLHRDVCFDLAHHVTFVNYWLPTFLPLLPIPFVWGPVGGGESTPRSFRSFLSLRGRMYETTREFARALGELNPYVRFTARRAAMALATTHETEGRLRELGCRNVSVFTQASLPAEEIHQFAEIAPRHDAPFRVFSMGRLVHLKGFDLGLRAFAQFHARFPESEYWLIGDGPERKRLEQLAMKLGVARATKFWGMMPREQAIATSFQCDILLFPALHESGGCVSVEAMAAGRPVICLDLGGPALQVTEATGIKIPVTSAEQAVTDLASAIERLALDPSRRAKLGEAGRLRIDQEFNWDRKGEQLALLYQRLVNAPTPIVASDLGETALPKEIPGGGEYGI
jgi:glycosyltransferase involved in cell wall biosynthesis